MSIKVLSFKEQAEENAIQKLALAWQLWSIAEFRNNLKGKLANEYEMDTMLYAWEIVGLDHKRIKEEGFKLFKSYGKGVK